jgi:hypothetical protein
MSRTASCSARIYVDPRTLQAVSSNDTHKVIRATQDRVFTARGKSRTEKLAPRDNWGAGGGGEGEPGKTDPHLRIHVMIRNVRVDATLPMPSLKFSASIGSGLN